MAYIIGLDLGIASVGWSVIDPDKRIVDLGVRVFKKAENEKGESLNVIRRSSRLARRRIYRRSVRLKKLLNYLIDCGLISSKEDVLKNVNHEKPWELRAKGLTSVLTNKQLAIVIYHICKHRGFYWVSSAEKQTGEGGLVTNSLSSNDKILAEKGYKTVGQMIFSEYPNCQRNKQGEYVKSLRRVDLHRELAEIFKIQKEQFSSPFITEEFCTKILGNGDHRSGFLWEQNPPLQGDALLDMVGRCRFEKDEKRAPLANYFVQRHIWLTKILNTRVCGRDCQERAFNDEERNAIQNLPLESGGDIKFSTLTKKLIKAGLWEKDQYKYKGLDYSLEDKDPEDKVFCKSFPINSIRKVLKGPGLKREWENIKNDLLSGHYERYNRIAEVLTIYKDDSYICERLSPFETKEVINALLSVRFDKFSNLSEKFLKKIVPYMEKGERYDEACSSAGYLHYQQFQKKSEKSKYLPPLFSGREKNGTLIFNEELGDIPRNPVVLRVINQARKVLNALVKKYGSPLSVHIELARDLAKSWEERDKINKNNKKKEKQKTSDLIEFRELLNKHSVVFSEDLLAKNLEKYRLYKEQECKSIYSGEIIDIERIFEEGYVEIDHILPYSKSFDDSKSNRVLVFTKENREKGNRIPLEYITNEEKRENFEAFVKSSRLLSQKKKTNLLRRSLTPEGSKDFLGRNLNDTRYACRFFKNYIDRFLILDPAADHSGCVVVAGTMTAYLRKHWGLRKSREDNRHHAMDAIVIACCSRSIIQKVAAWSRNREELYQSGEFIDSKYMVSNDLDKVNKTKLSNIETKSHKKMRFPCPWQNFRNEVIERVYQDDLDTLKNKLSEIGYTDSELVNVRTLFVSHACRSQRIGEGALHDETLMRQTPEMREKGVMVKKVKLQDLKEEYILNIVDADTRNKNLCNALKRRFKKYKEENGIQEEVKLDESDIKKIFSNDNPMHMPNHEGYEDLNNPIIRSVRILCKGAGFPVRNGVAKNGSIVRLDIFKKNNKFYCVPVYSYCKHLPNRACTQNKQEAEWDLVDDSFEWCFSLRQNDLIKVVFKDKIFFGYYIGFDRALARFCCVLHDQQVSKKNPVIRFCIKTALSVTKYHVDVLGNYYIAQAEPRFELACHFN